MPRMVVLQILQVWDDGAVDQINIKDPRVEELDLVQYFPILPGVALKVKGTKVWRGDMKREPPDLPSPLDTPMGEPSAIPAPPRLKLVPSQAQATPEELEAYGNSEEYRERVEAEEEFERETGAKDNSQ